MNLCIFCHCEVRDDHREHVLPDSLGGDAWGCLPTGLVCKECNQYFGTKVEQLALSCFPFSMWRVFFGVPTKKDKQAHLEVLQGRIHGTGVGGILSVAPRTPAIEAGIGGGDITTMRVVAQITEPAAVCQLLLKMALETIALNDPVIARSPRYDLARRIARFPKVGDQWFFLLRSKDAEFMTFLNQRPTFAEAIKAIDFDVSEIMGADVAHLRLPGFDLICPVDPMQADDGLRGKPPSISGRNA